MAVQKSAKIDFFWQNPLQFFIFLFLKGRRGKISFIFLCDCAIIKKIDLEGAVYGVYG